MNPIEKKIESLKNYMFSVVVENTKKDYYFTEKLIDCFITGTIPIYWGCPSIKDFFDDNGIINFNSVDELEKIIKNIDNNFYESKKEYIIKNYHLAKNYLIADDNIYKNLKL
jgi:thermostable 8-oxoguanine DNA glycosylase